MNANLLFEDNFEGTALNPSKWARCPEWVRCNGFCVWNDNMAYVDGEGHLILRMEWDEENHRVRSGAVSTQGLFHNAFGYYEARIKVPLAPGTWGAFWMMQGNLNTSTPDQGLEIDIVESIGNEKGLYQSVLHWNYPDLHSFYPPRENLTDIYDGEFHTFGVLRREDGYTFYIDGRITGQANSEQCTPCPIPGYLLLTCEAAEWAGAGTPACIEALPAEVVVDYVRVYDKKPEGLD